MWIGSCDKAVYICELNMLVKSLDNLLERVYDFADGRETFF